MPTPLESVRDAALKLSLEERTELAGLLWESIDDDSYGPQLSLDGVTGEELHWELERRAQDARDHPELMLSWERVRDMR